MPSKSILDEDQDHSRRLRPLLPAPINSQIAKPSTPPRKRVATTVACTNCKRHKWKCGGERPSCKRCEKREQICQYERDPTETSLQSLKRKIEQLEHSKTAYETLYDMLQSGSEPEAARILQSIRSRRDADTVLRQIQEGNLLLQVCLRPETSLRHELSFSKAMPRSLLLHTGNRYLMSLLYEKTVLIADSQKVMSSQQDEVYAPYLEPYYSCVLIDQRIDRIQPSKWTAVSRDDVIMRRLLRAYFRDCAPFYFFFQKDYFLDDMLEGRSRYCSALLVNAVLGLACIYDEEIPDRADYWTPTALTYQFTAEARRLWDLETVKKETTLESKITTIQAGLILNHIYNLWGLDKLGKAYTIHSVALAKQIGLLDDLSAVPKTAGLRNVMTCTAWALFYWQSLLSITFHDEPLLDTIPQTPLPDPIRDSSFYSETYVQYPGCTRAIAQNQGLFIFSMCRFWIIVYRLCQRVFVGQGLPQRLSFEEIKDCELQFETWFNDLPRCLQPENIVFPAHINLHIIYHTILISLHSTDHSPGITTTHQPNSSISSSQTIYTSHLEVLLRLSYLHNSTRLTNPIQTLAFLHLAQLTITTLHTSKPSGGALTGETIQDLQSTLHLSLSYIHAQAKISHLASVFFGLLHDELTPEERRGLRYATGIGEDGVGEEERMVRGRWRNTVASRVPWKVRTLDGDVRGQRVSEVLEKAGRAGAE